MAEQFHQIKRSMAEQFHQIKCSLAEQFCKINHSLAEQFRQIKRSLAEQWRFNKKKNVKGGGLLAELFRQIASPKKQRKKMLFNYMSKFRTNTKENERLSFKNYQEAGLSFNFYVS